MGGNITSAPLYCLPPGLASANNSLNNPISYVSWRHLIICSELEVHCHNNVRLKSSLNVGTYVTGIERCEAANVPYS